MSGAAITSALDRLRRAGAAAGLDRETVDAEAAEFAAGVCAAEPSAAVEWGRSFGRPESAFAGAAGRGRAWTEHPTALLARIIASGDTAVAQDYARALVDLAAEAVMFTDPSIDGMNTAGFAASAQLRAIEPSGALFVPAALSGFAAGGAPTPPPSPPSLPAVDAPAPADAAPDGAAPPSPPSPPAPTLAELLAELDGLTGLTAVKDEIHRQAELLRIDRLRTERGLKSPGVNRHLVFVGNPGTGKTTVARLVAGIYRALGVLPGGQLVEVDRSGLVAGYVGQTALKTAEVVKTAIGGVLFVDEAYSLATDEFGSEAINTLVKAMEDHRDDLVLIVAGYPEEMATFIDSNPGLASRFRTTILFADYTDAELIAIFSGMCAAADFSPTAECVSALGVMVHGVIRDRVFGNARFVRNLFEAAVVRQAWRLRGVPEPTVDELRTLDVTDLPSTTP